MPLEAVSTSSPDSLELLRQEARYLHSFLFAVPITPQIESQYAAAHSHVFSGVSVVLGVDVQRMIALRLDAEALELALRRRNPKNTLTQKFHILVYLAEVRRDYYHEFFLEEAQPLLALAQLSFHTVRTAWKLVKGKYLLGRHSVV